MEKIACSATLLFYAPRYLFDCHLTFVFPFDALRSVAGRLPVGAADAAAARARRVCAYCRADGGRGVFALCTHTRTL